jgi:photosystem I subunit 3
VCFCFLAKLPGQSRLKENPYKPLRFVQQTFSFVIKGNNSMRRLFALILVIGIWLNFAPPAKALGAGLVPCRESPEFLKRAENARPTTDTRDPLDRFQRYADNGALCGPDGLPRLIVDGRPDHLGDFTTPGLLFLYIAGFIGWSGRSYLQTIKKQAGGSNELKEIKIDLSVAIPSLVGGLLWPVAAVKELLSGELVAKDEEIPVSPR